MRSPVTTINLLTPISYHKESKHHTSQVGYMSNAVTSCCQCRECSKLIIQAGIKRVVYAEKYRLTDGVELLERAGVKVEYMNPDENISLE